MLLCCSKYCIHRKDKVLTLRFGEYSDNKSRFQMILMNNLKQQDNSKTTASTSIFIVYHPSTNYNKIVLQERQSRAYIFPHSSFEVKSCSGIISLGINYNISLYSPFQGLSSNIAFPNFKQNFQFLLQDRIFLLPNKKEYINFFDKYAEKK